VLIHKSIFMYTTAAKVGGSVHVFMLNYF